MCVFAISASAKIIYKDTNGTVMFEAENSGRVFTSYTGAFPQLDSEGNALTWYVTEKYTVDGVSYVVVDSFNTIDKTGTHASLDADGNYAYVNQNKELSIVSAYFPDNSNIVKINLTDNGYGVKYLFSQETQSNLLFLRVPNTLTELPMRIVQATQIIDFSASDQALYTSISAVNFYECQNMRSVDIPENVTIIKSGEDSRNNGHAFYYCTKLTDVHFAPNSKLETIEMKAFSNCDKLIEITLPNSLKEIGKYAFQHCTNLVTVRMGANLGKGLTTCVADNTFYNCTKLKYVYVSDTFLPTTGAKTFNGGGTGMVFFYTGTYDQYVTLKNKFNALGNNANFVGATPVEWDANNSDQYYKDLASNQNINYVVYGYNSCNAFYNGEHKPFDTAEMKVVSFLEEITFYYSCKNGCNVEIATGKKIAPLFTCLGYSSPEDGNGGIAIRFRVNDEAIGEYTKETGKDMKYGIFAVTKEKLGDSDIFANDGTAANDVTYAEVSSHNFVILELKITGFKEEYKDLKLALGVYVAVTDDVSTKYSYLQHGTPNENEKYSFVSYNDVVGNN